MKLILISNTIDSQFLQNFIQTFVNRENSNLFLEINATRIVKNKLFQAVSVRNSNQLKL